MGAKDPSIATNVCEKDIGLREFYYIQEYTERDKFKFRKNS